jgi:hypothetical protein
MKKIIFTLLLYFPFLLAGEISVSISGAVMNDYLTLVGDFKDVLEDDDIQIIWMLENPQFKFENGEALFLVNANFTHGQLNIRKDIKLKIDIQFNPRKNTVKLIITDPVIKMERNGEILGELDISDIYQSDIVFSGPMLINDSFTIKTAEGKEKFDVTTQDPIITIESGVIEISIDHLYE